MVNEITTEQAGLKTFSNTITHVTVQDKYHNVGKIFKFDGGSPKKNYQMCGGTGECRSPR